MDLVDVHGYQVAVSQVQLLARRLLEPRSELKASTGLSFDPKCAFGCERGWFRGRRSLQQCRCSVVYLRLVT